MGKRYSATVPIRAQDFDRLRHVSYPVYVVYMQEARLDFSSRVLEMDTSELDTVVVHLEADYVNEIATTGTVTVDVWVTDIGTKSFTTDYRISVNDTVAATGNSVQVVIEVESGDSVPIPDEWREKLLEYYDE